MLTFLKVSQENSISKSTLRTSSGLQQRRIQDFVRYLLWNFKKAPRFSEKILPENKERVLKFALQRVSTVDLKS